MPKIKLEPWRLGGFRSAPILSGSMKGAQDVLVITVETLQHAQRTVAHEVTWRWSVW